MTKLRKRSKGLSESPRSSTGSVQMTSATRLPTLPVIHEQSAFETQRLRDAFQQERRLSGNSVRDLLPDRHTVDGSTSAWTKSMSPPSPPLKSEPRTGPPTQRRPSPLRMSQEASADPAVDLDGPSRPEQEYRRGKCGPSCQKCGRPRKPFLIGASNDQITSAPPANWPLSRPANDVPAAGSELAHQKASGPEAAPAELAPAEPTAAAPMAGPSAEGRSKRRKYFSLPTKAKPSFKGPTELASVQGKIVEHLSKTGPSQDRPRPASAPSPTKSAFKGPADAGTPGSPPKATARVHFATDERLGRFAGVVRPPQTTTLSSARIQALRALTPARVATLPSHHIDETMSKTPTHNSQPAPPLHPKASRAAQSTLQANSAILYEWPLVTTLVNQPDSQSSSRQPALTNAPTRSSLSISKRPSRRTVRPLGNPHVPGPLPNRRTSSRHKSRLQQSRKVSYIMDHAANHSRDSMSIQILDMLQAFPGGELAATAKTQPDAPLLSDRPSFVRLQTNPPDQGKDSRTPHGDVPDEAVNTDLYSPSDYNSDDDDDDQPMPATPSQSDFSLTSYSIGDDQKLDRRPASTLTQTSFSIGDDRHLSPTTSSDRDLAPAPPSAPSSASDDADLASSGSPPSAPSIGLPPAHPLILTHRPDSEGMIPVTARVNIVDLPEVIAGGSEEDLDPDWLSWGALPGSYGGAGMWSGEPSLGGDPVGPTELGVAS